MRKIFAALTVLIALGYLGLALPQAHAEDGGKAAAASGDGTKKQAADGEEGGAPKKKKTGGSIEITGGRFPGDPVYVHLAPMVLPVISEAGVEQLVTIQVDVEVSDLDKAEKMRTDMPRVMDALMTALYGGLGQGSLRQGKLVNVGKVKAKATAALAQIMGDDVKNVLIQGVSQRML